MAFRFRKSVGIGVGRVNLSSSGASLSLGGRGHSVSFGKRGARATVGIPGTGMSWSTRLSGGRRRTYAAADPSNIHDVLEVGEASIEAVALQVQEQERVIANVEQGLAGVDATIRKYGAENVDADQAEEIETTRFQLKSAKANLKLQKIELRQARRNARKLKAYLVWKTIKGLMFWGFVFWVWWHFAHAS